MAKNNFDNQVDSYLGFLQNEYATAAISLFLILYAGVIAPKLPFSVLKWFENWIVQVALFFLIVYISNKNATIALIAAVAVLVTLMVANNQITLRNMSESFSTERYCNSCGSCGNYDDNGNDSDNYNYDVDNDAKMHLELNVEPEVEGILDENVMQHDNSAAGMEHAVEGGATTSRGGPTMTKPTNNMQNTH